jgi:hypothetical protein
VVTLFRLRRLGKRWMVMGRKGKKGEVRGEASLFEEDVGHNTGDSLPYISARLSTLYHPHVPALLVVVAGAWLGGLLCISFFSHCAAFCWGFGGVFRPSFSLPDLGKPLAARRQENFVVAYQFE